MAAVTVGRLGKRAEASARTRKALFAAAIEVVGKHGYAGASIARITSVADVAQGTFYNYFDSRQQLLDQLLPALGLEMVDSIAERVGEVTDGIEREERRLKGFFEFLCEKPQFYRILHEAEIHAPKGYREHLLNIERGYVRALASSARRGEMPGYEDEDLEVLSYMLMAIRDYLSIRYARGEDGIKLPPERVIAAYMKLVTQGLFGEPRRQESTVEGKTNDGAVETVASDEIAARLVRADSTDPPR